MKKIISLFLATICFFSLLIIPLFAVDVLAEQKSLSQITTGADIRAMSFNVLVDDASTENGGFNWGTPQNIQNVDRFKNGAAVISQYKPDVVALQECTKNWHNNLRNKLSDYEFVNVDVPSNATVWDRFRGMKDAMCTTIMYNKTKLELVHNEIVAYSEDFYGDLQGMRYASAAVFKIKSSGQKFIFSSTHPESQTDERAKGIRKKQMGELAAVLNRLKQEYSCPIVAGGDYNSTYNEEPLSLLRSTVNLDCATENKSVMTIVLGGFDINGTATKGIDFLFYSSDVKCKYFSVIEDNNAKSASDHRPIIADFDFAPYSVDAPVSDVTSTTTSTNSQGGTQSSSAANSSNASSTASAPKVSLNQSTSSIEDEQFTSTTSESNQTVDNIPKANDGNLMVVLAIIIGVLALGGVATVVFLLIKK